MSEYAITGKVSLVRMFLCIRPWKSQ